MKITSKQLLRQASSKISARAFLDAYSAHVRETYPETNDVLDMLVNGTLLPTPALNAVKQIVQAHVAMNLQKKNQAAIEKFESNNSKEKSKSIVGSGRYSIQFFIKMTNERTNEFTIEVYKDKNSNDIFAASKYQEAERLVDRRQNEMMNAVYAVITSEENGKALPIIIPRADSIIRANPKGKSPAVRNVGTGMNKSMKNYARARNDISSFSRG